MHRSIFFCALLIFFVIASPGSAVCATCDGGDCDTTDGSGGCVCKERLRIIFGVPFQICKTTGVCSASSDNCDNNPPPLVIDSAGRPIRILLHAELLDVHLADEPLLGAVLWALVEGDHNELPLGQAWGNVARANPSPSRPGVPAIPDFEYQATTFDNGRGKVGLEVAILVKGADQSISLSGWIGTFDGDLVLGDGTPDRRQIAWSRVE